MIYFIAIVVIIAILLIIFISIDNHFKTLLIKINAAFLNCTNSLSRKKDLVLKIIEQLDNKEKEKVLNIKSSLEKYEDLFDFYSKLEKSSFDINNILESHPSYNENHKLNDLLIDLSDIQDELDADNNYYNDNVIIYNNLVKSFPSNIVSLIKKYKNKCIFEKIKMEKYKILKEDNQ
ncbi:MAG: LemA family protein [Tenericutes bacterium]|jgi:hypothetical protein|nr:LemA family protein [Mycoplasmatota bacterium]